MRIYAAAAIALAAAGFALAQDADERPASKQPDDLEITVISPGFGPRPLGSELEIERLTREVVTLRREVRTLSAELDALKTYVAAQAEAADE